MIERAVYEILSADSGIANIVQQKIFPVVNDQGQPAPYVVYSAVFDNTPLHLDSSEAQSFANIQIDVYHHDHEQACELSLAIRGLLNGSGFNIDGHNIQVFIFRGQRPGYEDDTKLHRVSLDFDCHYH